MVFSGFLERIGVSAWYCNKTPLRAEAEAEAEKETALKQNTG
jgi:hypothetical protein